MSDTARAAGVPAPGPAGLALAAVRTVVFRLLFAVSSIVFSLTALAGVPFGGPQRASRLTIASVSTWSRLHRAMCRWILGQRVVIEGPGFQDRPVLYVFKHESAFETVELPGAFAYPGIFAKAELLRIPLWGPAAAGYGLIPVDRDGGGAAMRAMLAIAERLLAAGRPLVLFPEGTRIPHGERPALKAGFAGLYLKLKVPVVPVALDTGRLHPPGFLRYPGTITYRFGAEIPPGLPRREAEARVHAAINALNAGEPTD